jgi:hypothetical protein
MTPLMKALVALMFAMISRETPGFRKDPEGEKATAFKDDIAKMVEIDQKIAGQGLLVSPDVDPIILGGIRYYEARYRSRPNDGDCYFKYPEYSQEERRKREVNGMLPKHMVEPKRVCPAVGPMQINKNNRFIAPAWPEVRQQFAGIKTWDALVAQGVSVWKVGYRDRLTVDELRDPEMNVRLGYSLLLHWKAESDKDLPKHETRKTPPGSWITAWGWGKLSPVNPRTVRYVDMEGKRRCEVITKLMRGLEEASLQPNSGFHYRVPTGWYCGHEKEHAP